MTCGKRFSAGAVRCHAGIDAVAVFVGVDGGQKDFGQGDRINAAIGNPLP